MCQLWSLLLLVVVCFCHVCCSHTIFRFGCVSVSFVNRFFCVLLQVVPVLSLLLSQRCCCVCLFFSFLVAAVRNVGEDQSEPVPNSARDTALSVAFQCRSVVARRLPFVVVNVEESVSVCLSFPCQPYQSQTETSEAIVINFE